MFFMLSMSEMTLLIYVWNIRERRAGISISQLDDIFKKLCLANPLTAVMAFRNS